jgi:hypothetical protein
MHLNDYIKHFEIKDIDFFNKKLYSESNDLKGALFEQLTVDYYMFHKRYIDKFNSKSLSYFIDTCKVDKQLSLEDVNKLKEYAKHDIGIDYLSIYEIDNLIYLDFIQSKYRNNQISLEDISTFICLYHSIKNILSKLNFEKKYKIISTLFCNNSLTRNASIIDIDNIINITLYNNKDYFDHLFTNNVSIKSLDYEKKIAEYEKKVIEYEKIISEYDKIIKNNNLIGNENNVKNHISYTLGLFSMDSLKKVAKVYKIKGTSKMKKQTIIDTIIPYIINQSSH